LAEVEGFADGGEGVVVAVYVVSIDPFQR
jgi:hypothetical protein